MHAQGDVPIRKPRQQRSRDTLERILNAAEEVIEHRGFEAATLAEILKRAGASVGSFYARFPEKEVLLKALLERYHEQAHDDVGAFVDDTRWEGAGLEARVSAWVDFAAKQVASRRGVMRERLIRYVTRERDVPESEIRKMRDMVQLLRGFFEPVLTEVAHPKPKQAIEFAVESLDAALAVHYLLKNDALDSFRSMSDAARRREWKRAFLNYVGARAVGYPLEVLPGRFAVVRLAASSDVPRWATSGPLVSISRTDAELSIVCAESDVPEGAKAERGFACLRVQGPLPFDAVGVLASIVGPLAEASISILSVSTYDTDYALVKASELDRARRVLAGAGHRIDA